VKIDRVTQKEQHVRKKKKMTSLSGGQTKRGSKAQKKQKKAPSLSL